MPVQFDACVKNGGKVRTKDIGKNQYIHICFPKGGGSSIPGEVKTKQSNSTHSPVGNTYGGQEKK
jgi:hypothetical protein